MLYVGVPLLAFGLLMFARGWIYTIWPNGKVAERRKRRNLKVGFTTDMKLFGRKIRRLGLMVAIVGGGLVGWKLSMAPAATTTTAAAATNGEAAPDTGPKMLPKSVTMLKPVAAAPSALPAVVPATLPVDAPPPQ